MPYSSKWRDAEVFLIHQGITVYHTYKDDDLHQGRRTYWFTLDPWCGEASCDCDGPCKGVFDVRELPNWPAHADARDSFGSETAKSIETTVREAIEKGLIVGSPHEEPAESPATLQARKADCLVLTAPDWFKRADFKAWRSHPHVAKWIWADEGQDTFLVYDEGDLSDDGFLPNDIAQAIHQEAERAGMKYGTVWIKSV